MDTLDRDIVAWDSIFSLFHDHYVLDLCYYYPIFYPCLNYLDHQNFYPCCLCHSYLSHFHPRVWVWCIAAFHIYVVILSVWLFPSSVGVVAPSAQCEQWNYVVCVGMSVFRLMIKRIVIPRIISFITCRYSVNKSVVSSTGWNDSSVGCAFFGSLFAALCQLGILTTSPRLQSR